MRPRRVLLLGLVGCGRLGFDAVGSAPGGDATLFDGVPPVGVANVAFVTSTLYSMSQVAGLAGADAICNQHAAAAGLAGTYVAWLSTATVDARDRLAGANGWVRPDGQAVAGTLGDLTSGRIAHPPMLDENKRSYVGSSTTMVLTGTGADGRYTGDGDCGAMTNTTGQLRVGFADAGGSGFTSGLTWLCNQTTGLYCFGVDQQEGFSTVPVSGRRAFVSKRVCAADAGRAACDLACQQDAADAGLTGTYLALVALTTEAASARFDRTGPPWVRIDGVPLAATAGALFTSTHPDTTVDDYADGTISDGALIATGVPAGGTFDSLGQDTCTDWSAASPALLAADGDSGRLGAIPSSGTIVCQGTHGLPANTWSAICLEK